MSFAAEGARIWPVPPDWESGVQEQLAWRTDVLTASASATTQHRGLRIGPRRSFTFEVRAANQERRVADMLLAGHGGPWELPIWPDVQWLGAPLAAGVDEVPCSTAGFDFVEGGRALLYTTVNQWEVVEIDAIEADHLSLTEVTAAAFGRGSRLYPLRLARVQGEPEERRWTDDFSRHGLAFDIDEPCDWPALASPTTYLGHPVLDVRPDEGDDPTASYSRLVQTVDHDTALPIVHDLPGLALRGQQTHWVLSGHAEHTWYRSLLYTLCGRRVPMWLPSFASDLKPVATIAGSSPSMSVEWAGYTLFGLARPNRRDVRIELTDGTVYYRRITAAVEAGETETLTLSAALAPTSIAPARIRAVSFMALSTLASDEIELDHETDAEGVATSTLGWQAVVPDV
jgi:hypothetical protein